MNSGHDLKLFPLFVTILLLLFVRIDIRSQTIDPKMSIDGQKAFERLLTANQFEDEVIGYGGESSKLVEAYNTLLSQQNADAIFKELLKKATLPGRLYALCGLWFTDNTFFHQAIEPYRLSDQTVVMVAGCFITNMFVRGLIENREAVVIDINHPLESFDAYFDSDSKAYTAWQKRKGKKKTDKPPGGVQLDILNGGWSVSFRDRSAFK